MWDVQAGVTGTPEKMMEVEYRWKEAQMSQFLFGFYGDVADWP